jgi:hypothetical protein
VRALTFRDRLREEEAKSAMAEAADQWRLVLERVRGKIDFFDALERISSQTLLDLLEVPQRNRTAGTYRRLSNPSLTLRARGRLRNPHKICILGVCSPKV